MTAIIPAAGHGTRFAPFTKLLPKELLPFGTRPAIAHLVDEAKSAGADEVVIVTSPEKPLLKKWFEIEPAPIRVKWVDQLEQHGLGHAVLQAAGEVHGDQVLVILGDALILGENVSREMVALSRANDNASVIGCEHVPMERISRYGVLKLVDGRVVDLVEKPDRNEAPSDLAIAGRYLLSTEIFEFLANQEPGKGGEIQLTDAIRRMIQPGGNSPVKLLSYTYSHPRLDIGNPEGYYSALEAFYANR